MTTLQQFLLTANIDHSIARNEARSYTINQGNMLEATTVNGFLSAFKLLPVVKQIAEDPTHAAHSTCLAVWVGLMGNHPFNFKQGNITGDGNIASLNKLIDTDLIDHAATLNQFKQTVLFYANTVIQPFANTTLHDVLILRDTCPAVPVTTSGGYVTITTTAGCEKHNPRLMALNPRTAKWQRINSFMGVELAGIYDAAVPPQFAGWQLAVDDPYGVI